VKNSAEKGETARFGPAALMLVALVLAGCPQTQPPTDEDSGAHDAGTDTSSADDMDMTDLDGATADADVSSEDTGGGAGPSIRTISETCDGDDPAGGAAWTGWGNLQHPLAIETEAGEVTEPIFGQVWQEGVTAQPGPADGWEAQLVIGPLGAHPEDQPECFRTVDAEFNTDVENNDEWWVRLRPERAGIYGMFYRYRPPGGAWLYGDVNGSDDGTQVENAGLLAVDGSAAPEEIRVVTLNLRCRTDEWDRRFGLVLDALEAIDPHVIGFQEDCAPAGGRPQSHEIRQELASRLDRGYELLRLVTHQAEHPEGTFDEGIAMLTALPIDQHYSVDLPYENFPRKATVMDVRLGGGTLLRLINTHLDFGAENDDVRAEAATRLVQEIDEHPVILTGDFNATPDSAAYQTLEDAFDDAWTTANPGDEGLTMPSDGPTRRIDYVFTTGLTVESSELVDQTDGELHLSDHLGVRTTLTR
jgi:endonuclease/exonuclease/phosphatase family metal-dependent hydrolase